jgi:Uma2 family endonuclease
MTPVLDHPEVRESLMPISVEFYHELGRLGMIGEEVELLEGFLIKKMSKSPLHETIVRRFSKVLLDCLPSGYFLVKESPLTLEFSEPEPDLAVIAGDPEDFTSRHPSTAALIVEVAVSTLQKDRSKAAIYAAAGVGEYWLIEPERKCLTVYRLPGVKGYREAVTYNEESLVVSSVLPGFSMSLPDLFRSTV